MLNAFRHQRGLRSRCDGTPYFARAVLNAFRHQRGIHKTGDPMAVQTWECSTPFGIKEGFTRPSSRACAPVHSVLNAFRHQRGIHQREA